MRQLPHPTHREAIGLKSDELAVGQIIAASTRRTITDFDNVAAALLAMNTHPLHTDYQFASGTRFGKPLVVSPFLLSLLVAAATNDLRSMAIAGCEIRDLRFLKPVHPGDTISTRSHVTALDSSRCELEVTGTKADGIEFARFRLVLHLRDADPEGGHDAAHL